jgi:hypothetical protein
MGSNADPFIYPLIESPSLLHDASVKSLDSLLNPARGRNARIHSIFRATESGLTWWHF